MASYLQWTSVVCMSFFLNIVFELDVAFIPSEHRKHHVLKTHFLEPIACNLLPLLVPLYSQKDKVAARKTTLLVSHHLVYSVWSCREEAQDVPCSAQLIAANPSSRQERWFNPLCFKQLSNFWDAPLGL